MHILTFYNASGKTVAIPFSSPLASGAERSVAIPSSEFDPNMLKYLDNAGASGVGVDMPGSSFETTATAVGLVTLSTQMFSAAGSMSTTLRTAVAINNGAGYAIELPTAAAVAAGYKIYVFNSTNSAADLDVAIDTGSGDTIDGGAGPVAITAAANVLTFTSDGVSDWVTA